MPQKPATNIEAKDIQGLKYLRVLEPLLESLHKVGTVLGCRHLISSSPNGVEIQIYCAIIACMLIMIYTGHKPSKRTFEMICFYIQGWASLEELEKHIQKLQPK